MLTWFQVGMAAYYFEDIILSLEDSDWQAFMDGVEAFEDCAS